MHDANTRCRETRGIWDYMAPALEDQTLILSLVLGREGDEVHVPVPARRDENKPNNPWSGERNERMSPLMKLSYSTAKEVRKDMTPVREVVVEISRRSENASPVMVEEH